MVSNLLISARTDIFSYSQEGLAYVTSRASGFGVEKLSRIVRGSGSYLFDDAGKRYLDGSGGPAVFSLGHAHPEVNAAVTQQLHDIAYAYRYLFTSSALENLTAMILRLCGGEFADIV